MNILLIEDSRILRERLRRMINAIPEAHLVAETDNEAEAKEHMRNFEPELAVVDLRLKRGSGLNVLEHIKAAYPATILVVLTNYGQAEYRNKCMDLGADYFFDKSTDIDAFERLIAKLCQFEKADF